MLDFRGSDAFIGYHKHSLRTVQLDSLGKA